MDDLIRAVRTTPIIDNHAHPLLIPSQHGKYDLLAITTEAGGEALKHTPSSLAHLRAVRQLAEILHCPATWEDVLQAIDVEKAKPGDVWAKRCLEGIETILVDDGLDGRDEVFDYVWHDRLTRSPCKRIVRIEKVAQEILDEDLSESDISEVVAAFPRRFGEALDKAIRDQEVVGFKSVICYRSGLDIPPKPSLKEFSKELQGTLQELKATGVSGFKRLDYRPLNAWVVHTAAERISDAAVKKPLQFHTGLGDNDISLNTSSPSHLQEFIRAHPTLPIVLLHSSYPWTQEAGYLASVYENVYADIGEVFPMISKDGQERIVREILEFCPSEKILWSTDGHWFPETYILAVIQIREALEAVLSSYVAENALTVPQAIRIVEDILFNTSNKIYDLKLPLQPMQSTSVTASSTEGTDLAVVKSFLKAHPAVKFLRLQYLDYTATLRLRLIPVKKVLSQLEEGPVFVGITKACLGLLQHDHIVPGITATGEYKLRADFSSLRAGPSLEYACVQGDFHDADGSAVDLCPRSVLKRTLVKAKQHQLEFLVGFEIEIVFMSPDPDADLRYSLLPNSAGHAWSSSNSLKDKRVLQILSEILSTLQIAGIDLEQFHPEGAIGQYEFVLPPLPALDAVDQLLHAREIIVSIAAEHGLRATMVPKPFPECPGTACHAHMSIIGGESKEVYEPFYAGVLKHLEAISAFTYSNMTSYERVLDGCWAGGRWITWGTNNRETPLRQAKGSHWEIRCLDGLANMYLALSAIIAAGLLGVMNQEQMSWKDCQADPARLSQKDKQELGITTAFPESLMKALSALKREDAAFKELIGADVVARYCLVKDTENALLEAMTRTERMRWVIDRY
ncbi:hypothetical protein BP6252_07441 [Coleophoma cylindrospora]|uniref:Glutamine synthetase n=1 Tax=Coleophoma cylindrospora TaxID=1849047 RepID=A0A3D8RI16_9HELO|nr:hypothetical protein BP6252_07441 [Coleophoma cylindrospora]